jgi:LysM repeat protein
MAASVATRPVAYPPSYQVVSGDVEKGEAVENDMSVAQNVARQGFVRKTLGE